MLGLSHPHYSWTELCVIGKGCLKAGLWGGKGHISLLIWEHPDKIRWLMVLREWAKLSGKTECQMQRVNHLFCLNFCSCYRIWSLSLLTKSPFSPVSLSLSLFLSRSAPVFVCDWVQLCELMTEGEQTPAQSRPLCSCPGQTTRGLAKWRHKNTLLHEKQSLCQIFLRRIFILESYETEILSNIKMRTFTYTHTHFFLYHSFLSTPAGQPWSVCFNSVLICSSLGGGLLCKSWEGVEDIKRQTAFKRFLSHRHIYTYTYTQGTLLGKHYAPE